MRPDKQAHHCDVQNIQQWVSTEVVDQAVIGRRKMLLPGEASKVKTLEESAEAIVGFGNGPSSKRRRTHRKAEGPNIKMFQIRLGSPLYGRSLYLGRTG